MKPLRFVIIARKTEPLSVLSVEPYGMKPAVLGRKLLPCFAFSALGRAVWDETNYLQTLRKYRQ